MKSVVVIFVLSCLALVNSQNVTIWGNVDGTYLGEESFFAQRATSQYQVRAFTFPTVSINQIKCQNIQLFINYYAFSIFSTNLEIHQERHNRRN